MLIDGFDWDAGNREKCRKHGVSTAEIEGVFRSHPRIAPDIRHSITEDRYIAIDRNRESRPIFVAFSIRMKEGRVFIRPISARYMHRKEIENYEKENPKTQD